MNKGRFKFPGQAAVDRHSVPARWTHYRLLRAHEVNGGDKGLRLFLPAHYVGVACWGAGGLRNNRHGGGGAGFAYGILPIKAGVRLPKMQIGSNENNGDTSLEGLLFAGVGGDAGVDKGGAGGWGQADGRVHQARVAHGGRGGLGQWVAGGGGGGAGSFYGQGGDGGAGAMDPNNRHWMSCGGGGGFGGHGGAGRLNSSAGGGGGGACLASLSALAARGGDAGFSLSTTTLDQGIGGGGGGGTSSPGSMGRVGGETSAYSTGGQGGAGLNGRGGRGAINGQMQAESGDGYGDPFLDMTRCALTGGGGGGGCHSFMHGGHGGSGGGGGGGVCPRLDESDRKYPEINPCNGGDGGVGGGGGGTGMFETDTSALGGTSLFGGGDGGCVMTDLDEAVYRALRGETLGGGGRGGGNVPDENLRSEGVIILYW